MPYIPKEHEKYDLLPYCRKDGGEVFEYSGELLSVTEGLLGSGVTLMPYNYDSYEEYFNMIDSLIEKYSENAEILKKLMQSRKMIFKLNQKEEWSILKYIGPNDDAGLGLTNGKNYYWPCYKDNPVYRGVIDDEEFTAYLYPTEPDLWEILEDPTGMAYRTLYGNGKGRVTKEAHEDLMSQVKKMLNNTES